MDSPDNLRVTELLALSELRLQLAFSNGEHGVVDLSGELHADEYRTPKDQHNFAAASLDPSGRTVVWPTGENIPARILLDLMRFQLKEARVRNHSDFWLHAATADTTAETVRAVEQSYLDYWIYAATTPMNGRKVKSTAAARELCALGAMCLERNHPMPERLRIYLGAALRACAEGVKPDVALNLKRSPGKYPDPLGQESRDERIAEQIAWLRATKQCRLPAARELAARKTGLDLRRIEQIWTNYKPTRKEWRVVLANVELSHLSIKRTLSEAERERVHVLLTLLAAEIK